MCHGRILDAIKTTLRNNDEQLIGRDVGVVVIGGRSRGHHRGGGIAVHAVDAYFVANLRANASVDDRLQFGHSHGTIARPTPLYQ